ncbi:MAG: hypothetical protein NVS2B17_24890 [Candidatus Velthaea sp.]
MNTAKMHGLGAAAVRHSTHIGHLGEYGELAAQAGIIAIVTMGVAGPEAHGVVPFGDERGFLASFDASTSSIAEGKMR